ncbi:hypothetical protein E2542_SST30089 [Spatholobus suberectus]|nr:hypothetical protein E2542_SST30089 [Spatholobus suberectus]
MSLCTISTTVRSIEASPGNIETKAAVDSYHSLPLSMLEVKYNENQKSGYIVLFLMQASLTSGFKFYLTSKLSVLNQSTSLAEHLGSSYVDNIPETPNWLSEEMIKCISAIYCELTEPPSLGHKNASFPITEPSSQSQGSKWGSQWKKHPSFNLNSTNPFHVRGSKEFSGPYCSMIRIQQLCTDKQKLKEIEYMLRRFRSLVSRLEDVNPRNMKHEEKLAFGLMYTIP